MKSFGWMVMSSLAILLVASSTSWAQETGTGDEPSADPAPPTSTCAQRSVKGCVGELLAEQDGTITEVEDMLEAVQDANMFSFAPGQFGLAAQEGGTCVDGKCEGGPNDGIDCTVDTDCGAAVDVSHLFGRIDTLRNDNARAKAANEATTDDEYNGGFAQADMARGTNCNKSSDKDFVDSLRNDAGILDNDSFESIGLRPDGLEEPNSKFNNGKCDIFRAYIHNPGGPDDGHEVRVNERKENMCNKVCREKPGEEGKSKERFVDGMLDALSTTQDARKSLSASRARVSELGLRLAEFRSLKADYVLALATARSSGTGDPCDPGPPGLSVIHAQLALIEANNVLNLAFDTTITALDAALVAGNIVTNVLDALKDIMDIASDQTVAGFNARASAVPFTTGFHLSKGVFGIVDGAKNLVGDAKSLFGDANDIVVTALEIFNAFQADDSQRCSKQIRDDFEAGGQCVDDLCVGGPDDGSDCTDDSDCSDGAIVTLQADVELLKEGVAQTNAKLEEVTAELALMKSLVEGNRDLLLTPPGKREGFHP